MKKRNLFENLDRMQELAGIDMSYYIISYNNEAEFNEIGGGEIEADGLSKDIAFNEAKNLLKQFPITAVRKADDAIFLKVFRRKK